MHRLYMITDRACAERGVGEVETVVEAAVQAGVQMVQFRDKAIADERAYRLAERLHTTLSEVTWLINGRADMAMLLGADGVHRPGSGLPVEALRTLLGEGATIGVSTHDVGEAEAAQRAGADFVTLSPIFLTDSKPGYGPALGLEYLGEAADALEIPVYALGGVTPERCEPCREAGAYGVAVMSGIMAAERPGEAARRYLDAIEV